MWWKKRFLSKERLPGAAVKKVDRWRLWGSSLKDSLLYWLPAALLLVVVIVPIMLFIWLVFFTEMFVVQAITVVDAREDISRKVEEITRDEIGRITLRPNIFFVSAEEIETKLLQEIPTIRDAHVLRSLPGTVKIIIQEKTPTLLLFSDGHYYFVDDQGVPYEQARLDILPGLVLPTVKNDDPNAAVVLGVPILAPTFVSLIKDIQRDLPGIVQAEVVETHIPSLAAREVHVWLNNNWVLMFDVTRPANRQLEILSRVINETISEPARQQLEYIDLRIANRVYYRTKGGVIEDNQR